MFFVFSFYNYYLNASLADLTLSLVKVKEKEEVHYEKEDKAFHFSHGGCYRGMELPLARP